jgi:hypothetical protein
MVKAINLALSQKNNMTKIMNQSTGKESKATFYVVTRNGRRAWPKNYWTISEAQNHARDLVASLKKYNDTDAKKVVIMETQDPDSIN